MKKNEDKDPEAGQQAHDSFLSQLDMLEGLLGKHAGPYLVGWACIPLFWPKLPVQTNNFERSVVLRYTNVTLSNICQMLGECTHVHCMYMCTCCLSADPASLESPKAPPCLNAVSCASPESCCIKQHLCLIPCMMEDAGSSSTYFAPGYCDVEMITCCTLQQVGRCQHWQPSCGLT